MNSHNTNKYNDTHSMNTQLVRVPTGRNTTRLNNCVDRRLLVSRVFSFLKIQSPQQKMQVLFIQHILMNINSISIQYSTQFFFFLTFFEHLLFPPY